MVVIATGSELVEPGQPLPSEYQIYDSNSYLLASAARAAGAQVFRVGMVSDDPDRVRELITDQLVRADLILTTGGVSQGDYDVVKAVMPELGATEFVQVAMQPGKPQGFGLIGRRPDPDDHVARQPGQRLRVLRGVRPPGDQEADGSDSLHPDFGQGQGHPRDELDHRLAASWPEASSPTTTTATGWCRWPAGHGSHLIGDLSRANALVVLPEETDLVAAGEQVEVWLLDEGL